MDVGFGGGLKLTLGASAACDLSGIAVPKPRREIFAMKKQWMITVLFLAAGARFASHRGGSQ